MRRRKAFLASVLAVAVAGAVAVSTNVAGSDSLAQWDKHSLKHRDDNKHVEDAKAGKGTVVGPTESYTAVWHNGKFHVRKIGEKHVVVDAGNGEVGEVVFIGNPYEGLPPPDPAFDGVVPTPEQVAAVNAEVDALNEGLGIPKPKELKEKPRPRPKEPPPEE